MQLSRESILRMFEGSGSGGSGGGAGSSQMAAMLQGYATQSWVDENYVGIEFFNRLFRMHGDNDTVIVPNDLDTTIQNIEARFGLWTESFLSALGLNSGGGGGGSVSYLNDLLDVSITNPTVGEGLIYDGTRWVNGPIGGGGTGYSIPTTAKQNQWDTAYGWGNHADAGYAAQTALAAAVTRITTLEGYFTNGVANQAARLSGTSTYQAWGQTFWQNGTPKSIGSASARANINYAGSVSMGWLLNMEYDDAVHDPSINIKSSKTGTSLSVFMLSNSATSDHSGDHLAIGWGTSAKAQLPIRFFGREFVFNYTTNTMSGGNYSTAEAMRIGYRMLDSLEEPAVFVRKHLMIGDGAGNYFPVTYDYTNNALCFTGNIYATGGISALGFQSTPGGGTLFNGPFTVNGAAILRSTLNVTGAATLNSSLTVADTVTLNDDLDVSANARIGGSLTALGTTTLNEALTVTGAATFRDSIYIYYGGTRYTLSISKLINQGLLT